MQRWYRNKYSYLKYQVILFSFFNTSASLQDYINKILVRKFNIFVIIYLNNILVDIKDSR